MDKYYPMELLIYINKLQHVLANRYTFKIGKRKVGMYEFMKYYSAIWESRLFDHKLVEKAKKTHLNVSRETLERSSNVY